MDYEIYCAVCHNEIDLDEPYLRIEASVERVSFSIYVCDDCINPDLNGRTLIDTENTGGTVIITKINDAGRTQLPPNTATALGIGPHAMMNVEQITSSLKLY